MLEDKWFDEDVDMGWELRKVFGILYANGAEVDEKQIQRNIRLLQRDVPNPKNKDEVSYSIYLAIKNNSVEFFAGRGRLLPDKYDVPELFQFKNDQPAKHSFGIIINERWPQDKKPVDDQQKMYLDQLLVQLGDQRQLQGNLRHSMNKCVRYLQHGVGSE